MYVHMLFIIPCGAACHRRPGICMLPVSCFICIDIMAVKLLLLYVNIIFIDILCINVATAVCKCTDSICNGCHHCL